MTDMLRCYVASPLGFTEAGRHYYGEVLLPALRALVNPVDPWALAADLGTADASDETAARAMAMEIGRRNMVAIQSSQLLVAVLDGQEVDAGTAAEVGYASALGLTCLGLRTDLRQTGEPGATVNLQVESFIASSGGAIVDSLDELTTLLSATIARHRASGGSV